MKKLIIIIYKKTNNIKKKGGGNVNNFTLVGRLASEPKICKTEDGKDNCIITLAVSRNFKNSDGVYETDFIPCKLFGYIGNSTKEYCNKGDIVGVKGRLQSSKYIDDNNVVHYITELIAEKVTFLSNKK